MSFARLLFLVTFISCVFISRAPGQDADSKLAAQKKHGLNSSIPLIDRVQRTPEHVLKMFKDSGLVAPTPHVLSNDEKKKLENALAGLPPLHKRVLKDRLRSISFLDGMPNTALTSTINYDEPYRLFDITIRAAILKENVSEWLTWKERTCFDASHSKLSVSIDAGKLDAILYVMLHEGTHALDFGLGINPSPPSKSEPRGGKPNTPFTTGIWTYHSIPDAKYRDPLRQQIKFRMTGKVLPIDNAEPIYLSLQKTPFVSLYGSCSWGEDLAEYVSVSHFTEVLNQPFRILIKRDGKETFVYEPMTSPLVRQRLDQMKQFYAKSAE